MKDDLDKMNSEDLERLNPQDFDKIKDEELEKLAEDLIGSLMNNSGKGSKKEDLLPFDDSDFDDLDMDDLDMDDLDMDDLDMDDLDMDDLSDIEDWDDDELYDGMDAEDDLFEPMDKDAFFDDFHPELYAFEYEYMPALAETQWVDDSSKAVCLGDASQVLQNAYERDIFIDADGFKVTREDTDGLEIYFYEFPEPPKQPFALYGVIVFGEHGGRYFTMEKASSGYMICCQTTEEHLNFGKIEDPSKRNFLRSAIELYRGNFTMPDD